MKSIFNKTLSLVIAAALIIGIAGIPASVHAAGTGTISGTLYHLDGSPITGVAIQVDVLARADETTVIASVTTNPDDGTYVITGLDVDTPFALAASAGGYIKEYYNNVGAFAWAETIQLTDLAPDRVIDIDLAEDTTDFGAVEQMTFNTRAGRLLNDLEIRRAIAYGTDRERILREVWLTHSELGVVKHTLIDSGAWFEASQSDLTIYTYDPTKAEGILTAAGWTDTDADGFRDDGAGNKLSLDFKTTPASIRIAASTMFVDQMAEIGIEVIVTIVSPGYFFGNPGTLTEGDFDIAEFAWVNESMYRDNFYGIYNAGDAQNHGGFENLTMEGYYNNALEAKVAGDQSTFLSNALLWQKEFSDNLPAFPLITRYNITPVEVIAGTDVTVTSDNVTATFANVSGDGMFGTIKHKYHDLDVPAGYEWMDQIVYEIDTSALFDTAEVCITYPAGHIVVDELRFKLFHLVGLTTWEEITPVTIDTLNDTICGNTTSFSPFAIMMDAGITYPGSIGGTLYQEDGITPFTRGAVTIRAESTSGEIVQEATSNIVNGAYLLENLPEDMEVVVHQMDYSDGITNTSHEYFPERSSSLGATILTIPNTAPYEITAIDFTINDPSITTLYEQFTFNVDPARILGKADGKVIRKAIAFGTDRERILNKAFLPNSNYGVILNAPFPPDFWASPSYYEVSVYPFDPVTARSLLNGAGWIVGSDGIRKKGGVRLHLDFATTTAYSRTLSADIFKQNMKDIGVEIDVHLIPAGELFGNPGTLTNHDFDIAEFAWVSVNNQDDSALIGVHVTNDIQNYGFYSNPEADDAYYGAKTATTRTEMLPFLLSYYQITTDDMPSLSLFTRTSRGTPVSTPKGTNVTVTLPDVDGSIKFDSVATAGFSDGFRYIINPNDLPIGYTLVNNGLYQIGSSARMTSGTYATVCVGYDDSALSAAEESRIQLYHLSMTTTRHWERTTTSLNTTTNKVCGKISAFSTFAALIPPLQSLTFQSSSAQDGHILESTETSNTGGSMNSTAAFISLGDDASDKQYRGILSFNTASLADNAAITAVTLKIREYSITGTNPFTTHGNFTADLKKGAFGTSSTLALEDFNATATKTNVLTFAAPVDFWYSANLIASARSSINKVGITQFRLRFSLDDNDNRIANILKIYSGNSTTTDFRPILIIEYYIP